MEKRSCRSQSACPRGTDFAIGNVVFFTIETERSSAVYLRMATPLHRREKSQHYKVKSPVNFGTYCTHFAPRSFLTGSGGGRGIGDTSFRLSSPYRMTYRVGNDRCDF